MTGFWFLSVDATGKATDIGNMVIFKNTPATRGKVWYDPCATSGSIPFAWVLRTAQSCCDERDLDDRFLHCSSPDLYSLTARA